MSIDKTEIKLGTIAEFGKKIDDLLEETRREAFKLEGARSALLEASKKVEGHLTYVDKDIEEDKLDLEQAKVVKKYILNCIGIINNIATSAEIRMHQNNGKVQSLQATVKVAQAMMQSEQTKLKTIAEVADGDNVVLNDAKGRTIGQHPGDPLKDRRIKVDADANVCAETDKENT